MTRKGHQINNAWHIYCAFFQKRDFVSFCEVLNSNNHKFRHFFAWPQTQCLTVFILTPRWHSTCKQSVFTAVCNRKYWIVIQCTFFFQTDWAVECTFHTGNYPFSLTITKILFALTPIDCIELVYLISDEDTSDILHISVWFPFFLSNPFFIAYT